MYLVAMSISATISSLKLMRCLAPSDRKLLNALSSVVIFLLSLGSYFGPAVQAQVRDVRHCLSITNVDDRIECMEGRTPPNSYEARPGAPSQPLLRNGIPSALTAHPSFECAAANTRIERAICGDPILAEWDFRMGQLHQLFARLRP